MVRCDVCGALTEREATKNWRKVLVVPCRSGCAEGVGYDLCPDCVDTVLEPLEGRPEADPDDRGDAL